ncbi:HD domain-containing protein [Luedemannella flava]
MEGVSPRYLMTMPLHAVTEIHGEAGLRERFLLEIADLPEPDRSALIDALDLAAELHRDDRRTREPYLNHLLRTAIRIRRYYAIDDADVLVAALLHDAVEDHPAELAGSTNGDVVSAALTAIAARFNPRVADLVRAVTNPEYDPTRDADEQYREHVEASLTRTPWARVIKVSDFTDNGVGIVHTTGPKVTRAATKYAPLVPTLRRLVALPDTPLTEDVKEHIYEQLDTAEERFRAILG